MSLKTYFSSVEFCNWHVITGCSFDFVVAEAIEAISAVYAACYCSWHQADHGQCESKEE